MSASACIRPALRWIATLACGLALAGPVTAQTPADPEPSRSTWLGSLFGSSSEGLAKVERLRVVDPYLELHTGPGRGYPVFFVVDRDAWVAIELRHTDWYKVRTEQGQLGWVHREQLSTTLSESGSRKTFRELLLDDYLKRRVEMGAAFGRFETEPVVKLWLAYRLSDTLSLEAASNQVQGRYSGSTLWQFSLMSEPWFDQRISPYFGVGVGRFQNVPNLSLVDARRSQANLAHVSLGARYHLSDRFVARLDWTGYTVFLSDERSAEYRALSAGLSFFF